MLEKGTGEKGRGGEGKRRDALLHIPKYATDHVYRYSLGKFTKITTFSWVVSCRVNVSKLLRLNSTLLYCIMERNQQSVC